MNTKAPMAARTSSAISAAATTRPPGLEVFKKNMSPRERRRVTRAVWRLAAGSAAASAAMVRERSNRSGNPGPGSNATSRLRRRFASAIGVDLGYAHRRTQALERAIDPGLDPRHRDVECQRHIAQRHVEV